MKKKVTISPSKKLKKGDNVIVISGNWRGTTGPILKCIEDKVVVQGVNLCKKHVKKSQQNPKGEILTFEKPIHISNVKLTINGKGVKLKSKVDEGKKVLYYRLEGKDVVYRTV